MVKSELTSEPRPEWMTDDLLKTCVINYQKLPIHTDVHMDDIFLTYLVPKGENFMSVMYRAKVQYRVGSTNEVEELTLIIKAEHNNAKTVSSHAFEREIRMYKDVLPEFHQLLEKTESSTRFVCRYIHSANEDNTGILVLEDMNLMGYTVADKSKCLDLKHCELVLGKLAKLHAASMHYCYDQSDNIARTYGKSCFSNFDEDDKFSDNIKTATKKKIVEILAILEKDATKYEKVIEFYKQHDAQLDDMNVFTDVIPYEEGNKFNALSHGDFWTNNIMFKYGPDSSLEDVMFIDFQASNYNSIAYDFLYFIFSSANLDVRTTHYGDLKKIYFNSLVRNLNNLGYQGKLPTLKEFEDELRRSARVVIFVLTMLLPLCLVKLDTQKLSREEKETFKVEEITNMIANSADDGFFSKLVLASSDIMLEEQLCNAHLP